MLSWQDNSQYNTGYQISYRKKGDSWQTVNVPSGEVETRTLTGLDPHTLYEFRVRAYDDEGHYSDWSNTVTEYTIPIWTDDEDGLAVKTIDKKCLGLN